MVDNGSLGQWEGHEVTSAAASCNIGSGLKQAAKIEAHAYRTGEIVDIVVRTRVEDVTFRPSIKDDPEGPYTRIHKFVPLGAMPTSNTTVASLLDKHLTKVQQLREIPGQRSIEDDIDQRVAHNEANEKVKPAKRAKVKAPKAPRALAAVEAPVRVDQ